MNDITPRTRLLHVWLSVVVSLFVLTIGPEVHSGEEALPLVVMMEVDGITPNSPELQKAVRAQLSGIDVSLQEVSIDPSTFSTEAPTTTAEALALAHKAKIVFWFMAHSDTGTVYCYVSKPSGGRLTTRTLPLQADNLSSRFEVFANAIASLVEQAVASQESPSSPPPLQIEPDAPESAKPVEKIKTTIELTAGYAGSLFAAETVSHGLRAHLAFTPAAPIAFGLAYTQNFTLRFSTPDLSLSIASRDLDVFFGGRVVGRHFELRPGIVWTMSFRSSSSDAYSEQILPRAEDDQIIHSLVPRLELFWTPHPRFGVVAGLGAAIALNDNDYAVADADGNTTTITAPYAVKLTYALGLAFRL